MCNYRVYKRQQWSLLAILNWINNTSLSIYRFIDRTHSFGNLIVWSFLIISWKWLFVCTKRLHFECFIIDCLDLIIHCRLLCNINMKRSWLFPYFPCRTFFQITCILFRASIQKGRGITKIRFLWQIFFILMNKTDKWQFFF